MRVGGGGGRGESLPFFCFTRPGGFLGEPSQPGEDYGGHFRLEGLYESVRVSQ